MNRRSRTLILSILRIKRIDIEGVTHVINDAIPQICPSCQSCWTNGRNGLMQYFTPVTTPIPWETRIKFVPILKPGEFQDFQTATSCQSWVEETGKIGHRNDLLKEKEKKSNQVEEKSMRAVDENAKLSRKPVDAERSVAFKMKQCGFTVFLLLHWNWQNYRWY